MKKYGTARQATDENIIQRMRIVASIPKVTNTHSEHVLLFAFPLQQRGGGGTLVAQWLRCCATNRKVAGSIPADVSGFFIDIILPIALWP